MLIKIIIWVWVMSGNSVFSIDWFFKRIELHSTIVNRNLVTSIMTHNSNSRWFSQITLSTVKNEKIVKKLFYQCWKHFYQERNICSAFSHSVNLAYKTADTATVSLSLSLSVPFLTFSSWIFYCYSNSSPHIDEPILPCATSQTAHSSSELNW